MQTDHLLTTLAPTMGLAGWAGNLLTLGFLAICVIMILIVLIQRPQGGGLSGAFGSGAGSGQTAFGAKTGDALTYATIGIFVLFLLAAIGLNFAARPSEAEVQRAAMVADQEAQEEAAEDAARAGNAETRDQGTDPETGPETDTESEPESGELEPVGPETDQPAPGTAPPPVDEPGDADPAGG